jgi:hypothetical protein
VNLLTAGSDYFPVNFHVFGLLALLFLVKQ